MLTTLVLCLGLTLALELPLALLWGLRGRDLALCALVNVVTNPPAVLLHHFFPGWPVTAALELAAVAVEALYYRRCAQHLSHPWRFSLWANGVSFLLGGLLLSLLL